MTNEFHGHNVAKKKKKVHRLNIGRLIENRIRSQVSGDHENARY